MVGFKQRFSSGSTWSCKRNTTFSFIASFLLHINKGNFEADLCANILISYCESHSEELNSVGVIVKLCVCVISECEIILAAV